MRLCRWGAGLAHVGKNLIDGVRVGDICDDSQCATTKQLRVAVDCIVKLCLEAAVQVRQVRFG